MSIYRPRVRKFHFIIISACVNKKLYSPTPQSWRWVIFCDRWPTWPILQLPRDPHDPWPMTQSQTMTWVDHDYSRIMMSSRLYCLLFSAMMCNLEFWVAYSVHIFIAYTVSLIVYLYTAILKLNTVNT